MYMTCASHFVNAYDTRVGIHRQQCRRKLAILPPLVLCILYSIPNVTLFFSYFYTFLEPVYPISPSLVMIKNITTDSAIIQWTVSYISYSPETYVVKYGTSQDTLIQNNSTIYSGDDITITDMTYSVKLSNLKGNTTYYVEVVATNTAQISNMSIVERFRTSPETKVEPGTFSPYYDVVGAVPQNNLSVFSQELCPLGKTHALAY